MISVQAELNQQKETFGGARKCEALHYPLVRVNAGEVELWLRSLALARASCAKIRNLMSVVFNHGIRYEICDRNPIQLVRQSAKRKAAPVILSPNEVQKLISVLSIRE